MLDMKVPRLPELVEKCKHYLSQTGLQLILLIDTTFCPNSQVCSLINFAYQNH